MNKEQLKKLEADLWRAADSLRANSDLKASEYSTPVLGLIFLKFADNKYRQNEAAILAEYQKLKGGRREEKLSAIAITQCGFYLPDHARYGHLLNLPEKEDIANALKKAMQAIEEYKPELAGVLPQDEYFRLTRSVQNSGLAHRLLKIFSDIPLDAGGDLFGKIYEYFLANFAMSDARAAASFSRRARSSSSWSRSLNPMAARCMTRLVARVACLCKAPNSLRRTVRTRMHKQNPKTASTCMAKRKRWKPSSSPR